MNKTATGLTFLSGGSALNPLATALANAGLHTTHIISAFDNGGCSRCLRNAFNCIAIGDLRNRLCAVGGHGPSPNSHLVVELFRKRLPDSRPQAILRDIVLAIANGTSDLLAGIPGNLQHDIIKAITAFLEKVPMNFDWSHGSIGNYLLIGKFILSNDWPGTFAWASNILGIVGEVIPISITNAHLGAELINGRNVHGQQALTDQQHPIESPVKVLRLYPTDRTTAGSIQALPYPPALDAICHASALVYSWGSFYTSILPAFLVKGISEAVLTREVPRILLLNPFRDAELIGMSPIDMVLKLNTYSQMNPDTEPTQFPNSAVTHIIALRPNAITKTTLYNKGSLDELARNGVEVDIIDCDGLPQVHQLKSVIKLLLKHAKKTLQDGGNIE